MQWKWNAAIITETNIFKWYFMEHMHNPPYVYMHLNILAFEWAFPDFFFSAVFLLSLFWGLVCIMHICGVFRWAFWIGEFFEWNN